MKAQVRIWALGLGSMSYVWAQQQLPMEPPHTAGQSVTGAFEGWFSNSDGTFSILLGYFNRNTREDLDIPVGPNNHIDPGGPDQGQPTHFVPGRMWGNFVIKVSSRGCMAYFTNTFSRWIFSCNFNKPSNRASGRGGQPGT